MPNSGRNRESETEKFDAIDTALQIDMPAQPIACSLTDPDLRKRREGVLAGFSARVLERREVAGGFAYRLAAESSTLALLAEVIELERNCCAFLRFQLVVEPVGGPVWLELTGPPGTQEFLETLFR